MDLRFSSVPGQVWFESAKYVAVGLVVYAIDVGTFALLVNATDAHYLAANTAAKVAGAVAGFFLHKYVTFAGAQEASMARQIPQYAALLLFSLGLANVLTYFAVGVCGAGEVAGKMAADVVVIASAFIVSRTLIFRRVTTPGA